MPDLPFVSFGNDELERLPTVEKGDLVVCTRCGDKHPLKAGTNPETGEEVTVLLFYNCGDAAYLGAVQGRALVEVLAQEDIEGSRGS